MQIVIIFLEKLNDSKKMVFELTECNKRNGIQDNIQKVIAFLHSGNTQLKWGKIYSQ